MEKRCLPNHMRPTRRVSDFAASYSQSTLLEDILMTNGAPAESGWSATSARSMSQKNKSAQAMCQVKHPIRRGFHRPVFRIRAPRLCIAKAPLAARLRFCNFGRFQHDRALWGDIGVDTILATSFLVLLSRDCTTHAARLAVMSRLAAPFMPFANFRSMNGVWIASLPSDQGRESGR